jgi:hypothetical protein
MDEYADSWTALRAAAGDSQIDFGVNLGCQGATAMRRAKTGSHTKIHGTRLFMTTPSLSGSDPPNLPNNPEANRLLLRLRRCGLSSRHKLQQSVWSRDLQIRRIG